MHFFNNQNINLCLNYHLLMLNILLDLKYKINNTNNKYYLSIF